MKKMGTKTQIISSFLFFLSFTHFHKHLLAQPNTEGFTCSPNQTTYPCQTYAFYRAMAPNFLDLASIGDLFSVSRLMISNPSNISSPSSPLLPDQSLLIPLPCSCQTVNFTTGTSYSFANLSYTIKKGDTFYFVSSNQFQNLTTYQAVQVANPNLIPTLLDIGQDVIFPVFCKCPNETQLENKVNFMISYVFQPSDNLSLVASRFGVQREAIVDVNGDDIQPFDTVFVPVSRLPRFSQPVRDGESVPDVRGEEGGESVPDVRGEEERGGLVTGLAVGLGIAGVLLILICGIWVYREGKLMRRDEVNEEKKRMQLYKRDKGLKDMEANLMADVSDCLDKYRVFKIDELKEATDGFNEKFLIQGSVFKGSINGEDFAIKKMNWNAYEELKILQKVNHGNLVKLEGFCIDPEDASCYLIYEYIQNGSLHSLLHSDTNEKPNWKTRLGIAIDIANGLQYIHEHTRPRVVHKDIKSSNILLDSNMRAKIANFGLAKSGCNAITMHIVGTQGYIAPEYLTDGVVSTKMDIFSFGVVLLELVSGKEVVDEEGNLLWSKATGVWDGNEEKKEKRLKSWMDDCLLEESCSMENVMNVMGVAMACLHRDPLKRPSMVDIVYALCKNHDFFDISEDGLSDPLIVAR